MNIGRAVQIIGTLIGQRGTHSEKEAWKSLKQRFKPVDGIEYGGGVVAGKMIVRCTDCGETDICPHLRNSSGCRFICEVSPEGSSEVRNSEEDA